MLREIIEHRNENGNCDTNYWKHRFEVLSASDNVLLRSLFKELREEGFISVGWADNYPYILYLLAKGLSYFEENEESEEKVNYAYTNNFYGAVNGVQIQQGTKDSNQKQNISIPYDFTHIDELIQTLKKYDSVLNDDYAEDEIVRIAASLENSSSHPIANAIVNYATLNDIEFEEIEDFKNVPGKGIIANVEGKQFYAANESLIEGSEFNISQEEINQFSAEGKTVVFIGDEDGVIASLTVVDKIRDNAPDVIKDLKEQGVKTIMLTGDNKIAAKKVADEIGLDYVYSNLLPEDKLNILDTIRNKFGDVAMVGDGINDAPALARANIGIAMGAAGSDVAIETADVALMQDDISKLPYLFSLSQKTMNIIKQNISLSIFVKALFVILAILGLITLMMSVGIGDLGLTLVVILNSFRIARVKDPLF